MDKKRTIRNFWIIYAVLFGITVLIFLFISLGWLGFMPSLEELENPKTNLATEIYSEDGHLLGTYYIENRSNVHYDELSPALVNALIATEDVRFYDHAGVDTKALGRVLLGLITFSPKGGGSTITQQLAKNLFPRGEHQSKLALGFTKLKEWIVAVKLERNYSKEEIIAMYFNTVDFGSMAFGIKSAAKTFFGKAPIDLTVDEAAVLVGLLKAPTKYSPVLNPENALNRRNVVLSQMKKYDYITEEEYDKYVQLPIDMSNYSVTTTSEGIATYFREYLRGYLKEWCKTHKKPDGENYDIYRDGLRIYTTIDYKMQKYAEAAMKEHISALQKDFDKENRKSKFAPFVNINQEQYDRIIKQAQKRSDRWRNMKKEGLSENEILKSFTKPARMRVFTWNGERDTTMTPNDSILYYKSFLLSGLLSIETKTGHIKAYVGGINYKYFQYDHVKLAQRQVGSTFKPYVYTLAMQEGEFLPCSELPNVPVTIDGWTPRNSGRYKEGQLISLREALAHSVNYISAYLIKRYSPGAVVTLCRKMGITSDIPAVPSICLGTCDLTLYEMVEAMSTFPNGGVHITPTCITRICDRRGNTIEEFQPVSNEVISGQTAYMTLQLMKGVVESGTGGRLRWRYGLQMPIAGKTGTTNNNSDGWFMGITNDIVTGVWVGCEDRSAHFRSTAMGQGANTALPVFGLYAKKCYGDKSLGLKGADFAMPDSTMANIMNNCKSFIEDDSKWTDEDFDRE